MSEFPVSERRLLLERWSPIGILAIFSIVWVCYFLWPHKSPGDLASKSLPAEDLEGPIDPSQGESYTNTGVYHFLKGDKALAAKWLRKAALAGDLKGTGAYGAGLVEGTFPPEEEGRHLHEGAEWLMKAANAGDPYAQFVLGKMIYLGTGTKQDKPRGLSYVQNAARGGNPSALKFLENLKNQAPSD